MLIHYIIYGLSGLILEVFWTGLGSLFSGNFNLTGHTYLWMFFIYGLAIFFEPIHEKIRHRSLIVRGIIWSILIFTIEFSTGYLLDLMLGSCPWDYSKETTLTLYGYIRFDYFFVWFVVGIIFEKFHDFLDQNNKKKIHE